MPGKGRIKSRHLSGELRDALKNVRLINIVGPRQVGKTTLVRELFKKGHYITLDEEAVLEGIDEDPYEQLKSIKKRIGTTPLIIDEAQRSKKIVLAIKRLVDEDRSKGQFILTGSSNLFSMLDVADSLAGRMLVLQLWPLSVSEIKNRPPVKILDWMASKKLTITDIPSPDSVSRAKYIEYMLLGGFPEFREMDERWREKSYIGYLDMIVDRDVADIIAIRRTEAFKKLIMQMAARSAEEININSLCSALGIDRRTVEQYLDVLIRLSLISKLPAWSSGEGKRDIKMSKYHFTDTGMLSSLRGLTKESFELTAEPGLLGGLLESFVHAELLKLLPYQKTRFRLYHWRGTNQKEIDIIAESSKGLIGIEVKASSRIAREDYKTLKWFGEKGPGKNRSFTGIVFYLGKEAISLGDRIKALPVSSLWSV